MKKAHSFHIPVMGIGFTIDTPLKVAQYGMDSVISLVDDILVEKLRKMYSEKFEIPYNEITDKIDDFRAKRICYQPQRGQKPCLSTGFGKTCLSSALAKRSVHQTV